MLKLEYETCNGIMFPLEDVDMPDKLLNDVYIKNYDLCIEKLAQELLPENWLSDYSLLKNYIARTYERILEENKVYTNEKFMVFNTGLYNKEYQVIYFVAQKSKRSGKEWKFNNFCNEYQLDFVDMANLPERADYFQDAALLIFDWHIPIRIQYNHILNDHPERLPDCITENSMPLETLIGVIQNSLKRATANYKLAIPQYFQGKVQLLIPLYFENTDKPALALTLERKNGYYQASTYLTLEMAYNNARLITKPESNWLKID